MKCCRGKARGTIKYSCECLISCLSWRNSSSRLRFTSSIETSFLRVLSLVVLTLISLGVFVKGYRTREYRRVFKEFVEEGACSANSRKATCLITFDGGWQDNYEYAFPILKKYHIPATIFLPTDYIGTTKWFWQQRVASQVKQQLQKESLKFDFGRFRNSKWLKPHFSSGVKNRKEREEILDSIVGRLKRLRTEEIERAIAEMENLTGIKAYPSRVQTLNWQEISEMSEESIAFGSHGVTHRPFTELSDEDVANELLLSQKILENRHINYVPVLSYPNGDFNEKIQSLVKKLGYMAAVTTLPGSNSKESDFMTLKRVGIH